MSYEPLSTECILSRLMKVMELAGCRAALEGRVTMLTMLKASFDDRTLFLPGTLIGMLLERSMKPRETTGKMLRDSGAGKSEIEYAIEDVNRIHARVAELEHELWGVPIPPPFIRPEEGAKS